MLWENEDSINLVDKLADTNDAPEDSETHALRNIVNITEQEIPLLEARLAQMISIRGRAKIVLSPWRRVPVEILLKVAQSVQNDAQPTDAKGTLWVMGRVCGRWREIVLGAPLLWTNVFVDLSPAPNYEKDLLVLRTWLTRSKELPLDVRVRTTKFPRAPSNQMVDDFLQVLVDHCQRWQGAHFNLGLISEHWSAFSRVKGQMPNLQQLHLDGYLGPGDAFQIAPQLHTVSIGHFRRLSSFTLPPEITDFTVDGFSLKGAGLQYLSQYPCLVELTINDSSSLRKNLGPLIITNANSNDQLSLTFPRLQKLSFTFNEWGRLDIKESLATKLVLPIRLQHVEVSKLSYLGELVAPLQCTFPSLTINHPYFFSQVAIPSVNEAVAVLRPLSLLTTLSLHGLHDLGDHLLLIRELTIPSYDSPPSFLPCLEDLTISIGDQQESWSFSTNFYDVQFHSSVIFDMLVSRWNVPPELVGAHRLGSFTYRMNLHEENIPVLKSEEMTRFDVLRQQGMRIEFDFVEFEGMPTSDDDDGIYENKRLKHFHTLF